MKRYISISLFAFVALFLVAGSLIARPSFAQSPDVKNDEVIEVPADELEGASLDGEVVEDGTVEVNEASEASSALAGPPACTGSDCVIYDISTQATCKMYTKRRSNNPAWHQDLSTYTDNEILDKDIMAYRIRWFNGRWSGWYVTGVNDIDWKFNVSPNTMRRVWSYFYDHTHQYIACG